VKLSVVIPIYNEEENINLLYEELKGVLKAIEHEHEIVFVDDGSSDASLSCWKKYSNRMKPSWWFPSAATSAKPLLCLRALTTPPVMSL
jgi:glycosyltransferase involved in cell wall biosynthesis